jgi:hypothetical protein
MVLGSYKLTDTIVLARPIVIVMHFLQAGQERQTLPGPEEPMTTLDSLNFSEFVAA